MKYSSNPFRIIFVLMVLFLGVTVYALDPSKKISQYGSETWLVERGLPQNFVSAVRQTHDGYLWLGTQEGLVRFDGVRFQVFSKLSTGGALNSDSVRTLFEDHEGTLWIGTAVGLTAFRQGGFTNFTSADGLSPGKVKCIFEDSKHRLWVGTFGGGLSCMSGGIFVKTGISPGVIDPRIWDICEDREQNLWIAGEGGLYRLNSRTITRFSTNHGLPGESVFALHLDRQGCLWAGTNRGVARFEDGRFTSCQAGEGLSHNTVTCIRQDHSGNIWIGTNDGLNRLTVDGCTAFTHREGLPGSHVTSIWEDLEGSLWIGIADGGLHRLRDVSFTSYSTVEGLSHDMVWTVLQDRRGVIWIGSEGGNLDRFKAGKIDSLRLAPGSASLLIHSLYEDSRGSIWVGSDKGLYRLSPPDYKKNFRYSKYNGLSDDLVLAIIEDRPGSLWIGTGNGLNHLKDGQIHRYFKQDGLAGNEVSALSASRDGSLWIGCQDGGVSNLGAGGFKNFTTHEGLSHHSVNCLYQDGRGSLWIGTDGGGLNRLQEGEINCFNSHAGLFSDFIHQVLEDDQGRLWMSCDRGIFCVARDVLEDYARGKRDNLVCRSFNESDGMRSRVCNGGSQPAGWKSRDGVLWFPCIKGVVAVDPGNIRENTFPPPVRIESVMVDRDIVDPRRIASGEPVKFPAGRKRIEFRYTALTFINPGKVFFKYKLEGYDQNWIDGGTTRNTNYMGIEPGSYTFKVIACNSDGVWSGREATFSFILIPYFYQTWWFSLLCALLLVMAAFALHRYRLRLLKARKVELESLVARRTRELDDKNRELKKQATLDGLTGIYNYRWLSDFLEREWRRSIRDRRPVAIVLIDVDFFKLYNDTYGHQAGDECLKKIADSLYDACRRPGDVVARYGGEEFIAVFSDTTIEEAAALSEKMREGIEALEAVHEASAVNEFVTISLGCSAMIPSQEDTWAGLVKCADEALYQSKLNGRNRLTLKECRRN